MLCMQLRLHASLIVNETLPVLPLVFTNPYYLSNIRLYPAWLPSFTITTAHLPIFLCASCFYRSIILIIVASFFSKIKLKYPLMYRLICSDQNKIKYVEYIIHPSLKDSTDYVLIFYDPYYFVCSISFIVCDTHIFFLTLYYLFVLQIAHRLLLHYSRCSFDHLL